MMKKLSIFFSFGIFMCMLLRTSAFVKRYFVSDYCGRIIGPNYGSYIEFHREAKLVKNVIQIPDNLKGTIFDCSVILKGMPAINDEGKHVSIFWRKMTINDPDIDKIRSKVSTCGRSYVTVFQGEGEPLSKTYVLCGKDAWRKDFEWNGQSITVAFHVDYRNTSVDDTTVDGYRYPDVNFKLDFTSFDYVCNDSQKGKHMQCNDSLRCLDDSLRCDSWYSKNCHSKTHPEDNSDNGWQYPAQCMKPPTTIAKKTTRITTTSKPTPPPLPINPLPIVIPLCVVSGLCLSLICCWKPGVLIWRCARLRNTSIGRQLPCCRRSSFYMANDSSTGVTEGKNVEENVNVEKSCPINKKASKLSEEQTDISDTDIEDVSKGWHKFLIYDGGYLRHHR